MSDFAARDKKLGRQEFVKNNSTWITRTMVGLGFGTIYLGTTFLKGDRVRIRCTAGANEPQVTGHPASVYAGPGQIGTVVGFRKRSPKDPDMLLVVRFDAQAWDVYGSTTKKVNLQSFIDSIHTDYMIKV